LIVQFFEDVSEIVLERVTILTKYDNIKINTIFNGEFVASDKRANKSATKKYELFRLSDLQEWYESRAVEPTLINFIAGGISGTR